MKFFMSLALAASCLAGSAFAQSTANYQVVPLPREISASQAQSFNLSKSTLICYPKGNNDLKNNAELLAGYIRQLTGLELKIKAGTAKANAIVLSDKLASENPEAYRLEVNDRLVSIDGASAAGNFYGIQTLRKSISPAVTEIVSLPAVSIADEPRFSYRGAHFDTSRHFFPVDSVKTFIDMLALHNINRLHWHITDDQGWRLEIKKHPKLTEIGSWRKGTMIGRDFESSDNTPYGGFYTQDDAREIVKYAADRHITVIPEIDLPGHMLAALTAYPELGCTGGPYDVWQIWGVADDVLCAGNEETYQFIDDVLTEVADIFPSEYIHIGGDECPKVRWEECPKCQAKIKELGLKSDDHSTAEQKLQSYVMERSATTLQKLGRKMIGWDEIIEGGLFPGATVMAWRGEEAAREAAKQGHDAILTPTNYCYFDYSQSRDPGREPIGIGGFVPVSKVYSLEPVNPNLTPEEAKHILGAQANLWTEYIHDLHHVQYMELPRLAAMSEVQWLLPEDKDYDNFTSRLPRLIEQYRSLGYNFAPHIYDVQGQLEADLTNHNIKATFKTIDDAPIYYTLDGSEPTEHSSRYTGPVVLDRTATIKAVAIRPEGRSYMFTDSVSFNKATSSPVSLATEPHSRYAAPGTLLTDGRFGMSSFNTGEWMGFNGTPLVATVDLGTMREISKVSLRSLVNTPNWIFDFRGLKVEVSADGEHFTEVAAEEYPAMTEHKIEIINHELSFDPAPARFVKVTADCETSIAAFHGVGEGKPAFIFVDEIVVD